jgi:hypothetical protein
MERADRCARRCRSAGWSFKMNLFTEVYDKSRQLLKSQCFEDRWSNIETKIKALLAADGFSAADAGVLDLIRSSLAGAAKGTKVADAVADEILALSRPGTSGFQDRAALLKTLKHIYFVISKGSQSIWVVDNPKAYDKWIYDKVAGGTKEAVNTLLRNEQEVYGAGNREMFSVALGLARKISMDVCYKLAANDADTLKKARKWFLDDTGTDDDLKKITKILSDGFKKISALCNSSTIIFSDRPHKRIDPSNATTKAAVNAGDKMPVIYIYQLFLDYGKMNRRGVRSKLWQCAKTIIHETSHKILDTDDHAYGVSGIKPGVSVSVANAIKNADSWGIFALDVAGYLPDSTAKEAYN